MILFYALVGLGWCNGICIIMGWACHFCVVWVCD